MGNNIEWLPELEGTIPKSAYGRDINTYSVALEAWRRGLEVAFKDSYSIRQQKHSLRYDISDGKKRITFISNRLPISSSTSKIISNKFRTRRLLAENNISVAKEMTFKTIESNYIQNKIKSFNYPLQISPINNSGKSSKIYEASNEAELINIVNEEQLSSRLVIRECYSGEYYFAYVVGDEVVGAYKKVPAFVTGDGKNTISNLIEITNGILKKIPSERNLSIKLDKDVKSKLNSQNHSFDSVPNDGEVIIISDEEKHLFPVDGTEDLSRTMKELLVSVVKLIPEISQAEVEFVYDKDRDEYKVFAVNGKRGFRNYLYPMAGVAHSIPKAIIDFHFPETKNQYLSDDTPKYYLDYDLVIDFVQNSRLNKAVLPKHRYEPNLTSKKITFRTNSHNSEIQNKIRDYFFDLKIDGEFNAFENNQFELLIVGNYMDLAYFCDQLKETDELSDIHCEDYKLGVKNGYSFNDYRKDEKIMKLEREIEKLKNKMK